MSNLAVADSARALALHANGKTLSTQPNRLGRLQPTDPGIGLEAIRALYQEQGYVWLKDFLKRGEVLDFRGWVFSHLAATGLLQPGSDPSIGVAAAAFDRKSADRRLMSIVRSKCLAW